MSLPVIRKAHSVREARAVEEPSLSVELAECMGILIGDGGISEYQVVVYLHHVDDKEYARFVRDLFEKVFSIRPCVYERIRRSVLAITISRIRLVEYLCSLGLAIGSKVRNRIDIPMWIKENKEYRIACLRGLIDTDGSIFTHRYKVKGKWYAYKKLSFTSASQPLLESVSEILKDLGMNPRFGSRKDIRLDSIADMKLYFAIVGTSNPKHLRRYAL